MNAFRWCFALVSLLAVVAGSGYSQSFLTNGLVAYYPFSGNGNDASGHGFDGAVVGATPATDRFGSVAAFRFDEQTCVVTVTQLASVVLPELSLSIWVNLTAAPTIQADVLTKWRGFSYSLEDYAVTILADRRVTFGNGRHGNGYYELPNHCGLTSAGAITLDQWHHIVATLDSAGTGRLWVDGVLQATDNILPLLAPATEPVRIGQCLYTASAPYNAGVIGDFKGSIDDVRIYNRALSSSEAQELFSYESQAQPCVPRRATATAQLVGGFVVGATVTDPGCGYTSPPTVQVVGTGSGATAVATLSNGAVSHVTITGAGFGYETNNTHIRIASPPFMPWLELGFSKVKVTQHVTLGKHYVLESSIDLTQWRQVGDQFTANDEVIVQEFDIDLVGRFFRIRQVP